MEMLSEAHSPTPGPLTSRRLRRSKQDMEAIHSRARHLGGSTLCCLLLYNLSQPALLRHNRNRQTSNKRSRLASSKRSRPAINSPNKLALGCHLNRTDSIIRISSYLPSLQSRNSPQSLHYSRKRLDLHHQSSLESLRRRN